MITFPNCKINLGLWVTQRRTDGYHNIQTVMIPVPWCDILEMVPAKDSETSLTVTGAKVDSPKEANLCFRAWQLMADKYSIPAVKIHLHKVIPMGAGLGGGSSDGAFALRMLNEMFSIKLDNTTLQMLAMQLGMDCPFFIENVPALATGRGEILQPVSVNLDGYHLIIVKPAIHVSTAVAFAGIKPLYRGNPIDEITTLPPADWRLNLYNDFEDTVLEIYPDIREIKNSLYRKGALYASMSGSGSVVYGIFKTAPVELEFAGCEVFKTLFGSHA